MSFHNLSGQQFGTLIADEYVGHSKWKCHCIECGNVVYMTTSWLHKNVKLGRDGCKHTKQIHIGDTFGYLTIIEQADDYVKPKSGAHERRWGCKCICGKHIVAIESNLKGNKTMSCGFCSNRISIPEKTIFYYLSEIFDDILESYRPDWLNGREIDIFIPSLDLGIEYDGEAWHRDVTNDLNKDLICNAHGVKIIHVREPKCPACSDFQYAIITPKPTTNGTHMTEVIIRILDILQNDFHVKCNLDVDCLRDNADICKTVLSSRGFNSLMLKAPDIAKEWDYNKNYPLTPNDVPVRSGKKAWWLCSKGHSYSSVIASRTGSDSCGCPICSNKGSALYKDGLYIGEHSLLKEKPDIAKEFMESKNGVSADNIAVSSNKKMWFKCSKCGYEWQSKVNNRTSSNNQGCPICSRENVRLNRCKPVLCVETGNIYESATEAGRQLHINGSKISSCCRGNQKTAGGYHWKYAREKSS